MNVYDKIWIIKRIWHIYCILITVHNIIRLKGNDERKKDFINR